MTKQQNSTLIILVSACLSFGFFMEFQWPWLQPKKETPKQKSSAVAPAPQISESKTLPAEATPLEEKSETKAGSQQSASNTQPVRADIEMTKIQEQLRTIIDQTKVIQNQGQIDRARLRGVIDQVNVQKRLAESLKVQKPVTTQTAANTEEILRNTKIRLLAEEVAKTRSALETIKPATTSNLPKVSKPVQAQKTQKPA